MNIKIITLDVDHAFGYPAIEITGQTFEEAYKKCAIEAENVPANRLYVFDVDEDYEEFIGPLDDVMLSENLGRCKICGCTFDKPCSGGCAWKYPNLCSSCTEKEPPQSTTYQRLEKFVHDFDGGIKHFMNCLNLKQSCLDADAISWLNQILLDSESTLDELKKGDKPDSN